MKKNKLNYIPQQYTLTHIPHEVMYVRVAEKYGIPIGYSHYQEIIKKYPEHFPEEISHKRKWDSIPQSVHDDFHFESQKMRHEVYKNLPHSKGIMWVMENSQEYKDWEVEYYKLYEIERKFNEKLRNKYYKPYGV